MTIDPQAAIEVLTRALDFYDGGRRWIRGNPLREGRRCLISVLLHVAGGETHAYTDACHYLRAALSAFRAEARPVSDVDLIDYNDDSEDYERVQALILDARAQAELDARAAEVNDLHLVVSAAK